MTGYASKDQFQTDLLANLPNVNGTATRYDHQTINAMVRWFRTLSPRLNLQTTGVYVNYVPRILSPELSGNQRYAALIGVATAGEIKPELPAYQPENRGWRERNPLPDLNRERCCPAKARAFYYVTTPTENALELAALCRLRTEPGPRLAVSAGLRYSSFLSLGPSLVRQYAPGEPRDDFSVIDSTRYRAGQVSNYYGGPEPRLGMRYSLGPTHRLSWATI